ncbi:MAG: chromosome segregation protein SMC, partial [Collinsella intestinalis]
HDSGLGKDTHSIISQGKLDAILQSRPEERRSLIEEAAGISKHKRRKERALRKIKSMDEHLTRARDINREISRQLKPLERQVDRARKYKDLSARANELTQILAVDELRQLQAQWVDLESASRESAAALELARYRLSEKERELEKLQVMLEEKGLFVGDLGEQRRHMQDVVGRIGSDMRLLEEKGRNMVARLSEMRGTLSASEHQRKRTLEELSDINRQLDEERAAAEVAGVDVSSLEPAADELHTRRVELDELISTLTRSVRDAQRNADNAALELVKVRETLPTPRSRTHVCQALNKLTTRSMSSGLLETPRSPVEPKRKTPARTARKPKTLDADLGTRPTPRTGGKCPHQTGGRLSFPACANWTQASPIFAARRACGEQSPWAIAVRLGDFEAPLELETLSSSLAGH